MCVCGLRHAGTCKLSIVVPMENNFDHFGQNYDLFKLHRSQDLMFN